MVEQNRKKNHAYHSLLERQLATSLIHGNIFSHNNQKYAQLEAKKHEKFILSEAMGLQNICSDLRCKHLTFQEFVRLDFKDNVP